MMDEVKPYYTYPVSVAIREYLRVKGEGYANEFYRLYRDYKSSTSYMSITRYFYLLKRIGLIRFVRKEEGDAPIPRSIYELVEERIDDDLWKHPQKIFKSQRDDEE